jgi:hypothetical protein
MKGAPVNLHFSYLRIIADRSLKQTTEPTTMSTLSIVVLLPVARVTSDLHRVEASLMISKATLRVILNLLARIGCVADRSYCALISKDVLAQTLTYPPICA